MDGKCRITGEPLELLFQLGPLYVNDFVDQEDVHNRDKVDLKVGIGPTGLVQLFDSYSPDKMYKRYWYVTGINERMVQQMHNMVDCANHMDPNPNWGGKSLTFLDIGANDGTLLKYVRDHYAGDAKLIGVDPSDVAGRSTNYDGDRFKLVNTYFNAEEYLKVAEPAHVIFSAAMFYDLDDPIRFLKDVNICLAPQGLFVLQLSYLPLILAQNSFDGIGEEHLCYYSLKVLMDIMKEAGLYVLDAEINDVNSGSIRLYVCKEQDIDYFNSGLHTQIVRRMRLHNLLNMEVEMKLEDPETYRKFFEELNRTKTKVQEFLQRAKLNGKTIYGYGASTKGNTILQYFELGPDLITAIAERAPAKYGKFTVGTGIPIVSEDEMRRANPDYLLALPYTFIQTFLNREQELIDRGTQFVVPLPDLYVVGK